MELALYHPEHGYYASRERRSGREGDFYTSVDVGPLFGELLAVQIARMADAFDREFDLVEAAAGNARLTRDVLDALQRDAPAVYERVRVRLVERSASARSGQLATLGPHGPRLFSADAGLPPSFDGILFANELLDAFPVHVVVMRDEGARELFVDVEGDRLIEREGAISIAAVLQELQAGPPLEAGLRTEINLAAREWIFDAASRLTRGFILLLDYGDRATALRSAGRPEGTLRAFARHRVTGRWLDSPGEQDLTSHVDFTALERWAKDAGLEPMGRSDQTRFLISLGAIERMQRAEAELPPILALRRRLALKTLLVPGGMGSTHSAVILGKNVERWRGTVLPAF